MIYHSYQFFSIKSSFHILTKTKQESYKKEFLKALQEEKHTITFAYATLGLKANTTFLLWFQADTVEAIQDHLNNLLHTNLGNYLKINFSLLGLIRKSQYSSSDRSETRRKGGAYLIIYPFTKTQQWYKLTFKKRKELMKGHITIGRKYPQITQLLLYAYGIDDNEFIVSYETDDLLEFQSLVMELRSDAVRDYTLKDTPIFTCIYKTLQELMNYI
jgi:chlorite dismutase